MQRSQQEDDKHPASNEPGHNAKSTNAAASRNERRHEDHAEVPAPEIVLQRGPLRSSQSSSIDRQKARDYVQSIVAHSRRHTANSLYPGQNYLDLAAWIQQEPHQRSILDDQHVLGVLHCLAPGEPSRMLQYRYRDIDSFMTQIRSTDRINRVLFLRGYASPDWISIIGSRFRIDPEFFNRHLAFMTTLVYRSAFSTPSLPSSCRNIITLRINTIIEQNGFCPRSEYRNLSARRRSEAASLKSYARLYQTRARYGDSIVREYYTLDERFSIVEQEISVCIRKSKQDWFALVWADVGRDLALGPSGPWCANHLVPGSSANSFPVIQHHVEMVARQKHTEGARPPIDISETAALKNPTIHQSTMLLPFDCNYLADNETVQQDAFYAVNAAFQHAAFSEVQFLNLMEWQIDKEMGILVLERDRSCSLDNLQYFRSVLDRHVRQMRDVLQTTMLQRTGNGPSANDARSQRKASLAVDQLVGDYDGLLTRASELCQRCTEGMGVMMNRAIVAESKKAIDQAERLKKLTVLASFFIPLSFTTSLFGANFSEIAPGNYLSIWVFFAVSVPVVLLSYCYYILDIAGLIGLLWKCIRSRRRR